MEYEDFRNDLDDYFDEHERFKNSIIYLDEPLRDIVNNMEINVIYGNITVNLLDFLPLFKKGYTTDEYLRKVFVIYQYLYDIDPRTDPLYIRAFNGEVPDEEEFYQYQKYYDFMEQPISEILLENDSIDKLTEFYYQYETDVNGDIKLESFILNMNNTFAYDWVQLLLNTKLRLYTAIILEYDFMVEAFLNEIDPRDYNNEAYHLAVKIGYKENINLIKNKIIELNWLDKQVVIKEFNKYDFLYDDIIQYYQSRKY